MNSVNVSDQTDNHRLCYRFYRQSCRVLWRVGGSQLPLLTCQVVYFHVCFMWKQELRFFMQSSVDILKLKTLYATALVRAKQRYIQSKLAESDCFLAWANAKRLQWYPEEMSCKQAKVRFTFSVSLQNALCNDDFQYELIYWLFSWLINETFGLNHNLPKPKGHFQMSCFVQATAQNPKTFSLLSQKTKQTRKHTNSRSWDQRMKNNKWLINYQNSCQCS